MTLGASDVRYLLRTPDEGLTLVGLIVQSVRSPTEREAENKAERLDRTKALHGPQTQAYGETRYSENKG